MHPSTLSLHSSHYVLRPFQIHLFCNLNMCTLLKVRYIFTKTNLGPPPSPTLLNIHHLAKHVVNVFLNYIFIRISMCTETISLVTYDTNVKKTNITFVLIWSNWKFNFKSFLITYSSPVQIFIRWQCLLHLTSVRRKYPFSKTKYLQFPCTINCHQNKNILFNLFRSHFLSIFSFEITNKPYEKLQLYSFYFLDETIFSEKQYFIFIIFFLLLKWNINFYLYCTEIEWHKCWY